MPQTVTIQSVMHVRDIMTTRVATLDMDDSMLAAKRLFEREHCHHAVVLERKKVFGVVSDRDILKVVSPFVGNPMMERTQDLNTLKKRVHQIMSRNLVTTGPDETVADVAEKMLSERVSCLPVVNDSRSLLGIVTIRDFVACSVGTSGVDENHSSESESDEGILIIIDGTRCYSPPVAIARLLREAERSNEEKHGVAPARVKCLPNPRNETIPD